MNDKFTISPTPKQAEFLVSPAKFSCFSGGYGAGKTIAGCLRAMLLSRQPGNVGLIGRLSYPELRDTTRKTFFEVCPPEYYDPAQGGEWKVSENYLRLINRSEIIFRHLDDISESELRSLNLGWFFIDQAEEIGEKVFMLLQSRLRLNKVSNRYGFVVCNPEPYNWIYKRWKEPLEKNQPDEEYHLVETSSYDNPYLPSDYIPTLLKSYPEELVRRYVKGEWNVVEGMIFTEYDPKIHIVKPFDIPKGWERLVAIDHGMVNPTCALFGAIDYDNNVFIYDEYYSPGIVSTHAKTILEMAGDQEISMWLIDPSTAAKTREKDGMMWSVLEEYEDYGIYAIPANNEKLAGINRVREFMRVDPNRKHVTTNENGAPRLYVFSNCINLNQEISQYQWKKLRSLTQRNAPEIPRDFSDHAVDALRYMIMSRFPAPQIKPLGTDLISRVQRRNSDDIANPLPSKYTPDEVLGEYGGEMGSLNSYQGEEI